MALSVEIKSMSVVVEVTSDAFCTCEGGCQHKCHKSRSYTIPHGLVRMVGDNCFVQLSRKNPSTRRLLTCLALGDGTHTSAGNNAFCILGSTDVLDKLMIAREDAIKTTVCQDGAGSMSVRWRRNKKFANKIASIPSVIDVPTPPIDGVEPITLKMLTHVGEELRGLVPVSIRIDSSSMTWLATAIKSQVESGDISSIRKTTLKRKRETADSESDDRDSTSEDVENTGDDNHGDVSSHVPPVNIDAQSLVQPDATSLLQHIVSGSTPEPLHDSKASDKVPAKSGQLSLADMWSKKRQ
jgi:hypothetical protein